MVNINYQRGYQLEYKAKKLFEDAGWMVTRLPASKSPADLMAFNKNTKVVVQCKKTKKDSLYLYGLKDFVDIANEHEAIPLLVYSFGRTSPYAKLLNSEKIILKKTDENKLLKEYLEVI